MIDAHAPAAAADPAGPLSARTLAAYGLLALPLALVGLPLYVFLPAHYAGPAVGMSLTAVGTVLMLARMWDVVTDPMIGALSDRWSSRWGRRRPWIVAGVPVMALAAVPLLDPPAGISPEAFLFWAMLFTLGATMIMVPYAAWGAEIAAGYHERARITAWREGFTIGGMLLALAVQAAAAHQGGGAAQPGAADPAALGNGLLALLVLLVVALPLATAALLAVVPELPLPRRASSARPPGVLRSWRTAWRNGPFRLLLAAYFANGVANGLPATLFVPFVAEVLQAGQHAGAFLLAYFAAGILAVPLWLRIARRFGKHRTWCAAMLWASAAFAAVPFLGAGDTWWFLAVCVATGLALGADLVLPPAMQADVVDLDTLRTGESRAGLFFAAWAMSGKLSLALGLGLAFLLLDRAGFASGGPNDGTALLALTLLYAVAPVGLKLLAVLLVRRFPIDARRQARLRLRLDRRIAAGESR